MNDKLNDFSRTLFPSIFKVYLSSMLIILLTGGICFGLSYFGIPGIPILLFIATVLIQEHIYHRIGTAVVSQGEIEAIGFKSEFIAKAFIVLLAQSGIMLIIAYVVYQLIAPNTEVAANITMVLAFEVLMFLTNSILVSYAIDGSSLGEGIGNGVSFLIRHPILNLSLGMILAGLTAIPFAGYVFFFICFVIAEYIRTYRYFNDTKEEELDSYE